MGLSRNFLLNDTHYQDILKSFSDLMFLQRWFLWKEYGSIVKWLIFLIIIYSFKDHLSIY